jgi:hypothetical protein
MVTTIHGFSGAGILPAYAQSRSTFVAISDADRYAGLDYAATIHHGVDLKMLPYRASPGDQLVSFGRIHPNKGTADAVESHVDGDQVVSRSESRSRGVSWGFTTGSVAGLG